MVRYPEIDPDFFVWGMKNGMSEDEIKADWQAYCDGLERFHEETSTVVLGESAPAVPSFCVGGSQ